MVHVRLRSHSVSSLLGRHLPIASGVPVGSIVSGGAILLHGLLVARLTIDRCSSWVLLVNCLRCWDTGLNSIDLMGDNQSLGFWLMTVSVVTVRITIMMMVIIMLLSNNDSSSLLSSAAYNYHSKDCDKNED